MKPTERRLYGALLMMCDNEGLVNANLSEIARTAGYKSRGGMHTYAIDMLERENKITKVKENTWRVWLR